MMKRSAEHPGYNLKTAVFIFLAILFSIAYNGFYNDDNDLTGFQVMNKNSNQNNENLGTTQNTITPSPGQQGSITHNPARQIGSGTITPLGCNVVGYGNTPYGNCPYGQ